MPLLIRKKFNCLICLVSCWFLISLAFFLGLDATVHFSRPLWDDIPPNNFILNYGSNCALYNFTQRLNSDIKIFDCVLLDEELDLYEVYLSEVWDLVDIFILVQSNLSWSNKTKPINFHRGEPRWQKYISSVHDFVFVSSDPTFMQRPAFWREYHARYSCRHYAQQLGIRDNDILLQHDADELIRRSTMELMRYCEVPHSWMPLCLQSIHYMYSFEWLKPYERARAAPYAHYFPQYIARNLAKNSVCLADAVLHCSFCFPTLEHITRKLSKYSHTDRNQPKFIQQKWLREVTCAGKSIFAFWGEMYSWKELIQNWNGDFIRQMSTHHVPALILKESQRFAYLLPGNCNLRR